MALSPILIMLAVLVVPVVAVALVVYVIVPVVRGTGWVLGNTFRGIGWFLAHLFEYVGGTVGDAFRFLSTIPAVLVLSFMTLFSVVLGRWSASAHFARSVRREFTTAWTCLYGIVLRRPLKLFWLHGLLAGVEHRVPEAMAAAPGRDRPSRSNQFAGYTIIGSLPSGGSGAKLYVAEPDARTRARIKGMPDQVVIKSFTLEEGSALPQIVRESRALESAKRLKAVYEHGMDERRFWYAMPFYRGDHLGIVTRQLHAEAGDTGLDAGRLRTGVGYVAQLAETLESYHREGLWHKDVKPENVIIGRDGAHLVDLGLVTPLHSAMTLTTHGTEYFRDPELVRQALRGVKVHQVDGAKFDVFGIGAVLYFLIENDFPAHGPLSRFTKRSPDAIKWIIRRAMADYHHRYESATQLVADLRVVAGSRDPFAVKPAELPSVRARAAAEDGAFDDDLAASTASEATADHGASIAGGAAAVAGAAAGAGAGRPRLRRQGFFSGGYDVIEDVDRTLDETLGGVDRMLDGKAADVTVAGSGFAVGTGPKARARARAIRRDARRRMQEARRHAAKAVKEARRGASRRAAGAVPTAGRRRALDGVIGAMVLAVFASVVIIKLASEQIDARPTGSAGTAASIDAAATRPAVAMLAGAALREDEAGRSIIQRIIASRESQGYDVVVLPPVVTNRLLDTVTLWEAAGRSGEADAMLEDELEAWGLYGVLELGTGRGGGIDDRLVFSTRDGADGRIPLTRRFNLPDPSLPLLLVNDHPRHVSPEIAQRLDRMISGLTDLGWTVARDAVIEADLRTVLPIRSDAAGVPMTPVLAEKIQRHELGGILRVIGSAEGEDEILLQVVRPDEVQAQVVPLPPPPPVRPAPAGAGSTSSAAPAIPAAPAVDASASVDGRATNPEARGVAPQALRGVQASASWSGMRAPAIVQEARRRAGEAMREAAADVFAAVEVARDHL